MLTNGVNGKLIILSVVLSSIIFDTGFAQDNGILYVANRTNIFAENGTKDFPFTSLIEAAEFANVKEYVTTSIIIGPGFYPGPMLLGRSPMFITAPEGYVILGSSIDPAININDLLFRTAPFVYVHPEETAFPTSAEWFLKRSNLFVGNNMVGTGETVQNLQRDIFFSSETRNSEGNFPTPNPGIFLHLVEKGYRAGELPASDGKISAPCYYHLRSAPNRRDVDIQYWFFYAYNPQNVIGIGDHEGDWEHVTVRMTPDGEELVGMYFARHGSSKEIWGVEIKEAESIWEFPSKIERRSSGNPVVFSARDSHASYPNAGQAIRGGLPDDWRRAGRYYWDCRENLVSITNHDTAPKWWVQYRGHWGTAIGPAFKDDWLRDIDKDLSTGPTSDGYSPVHIEDDHLNSGLRIELGQNYPNPFINETTITYFVDRQSLVGVFVFDVLGRQVERLTVDMVNQGWHQVVFHSESYPSGTYFVRLVVGSMSIVRPITVLK